MKLFKKIIFTFILLFSATKINAATLSIDSKSYDENTNTLIVTGSSSYADVMVSVFDGEDLLSFKTVKSNNDKYSATIKIAFTEDKNVTIKVGDINKTDYKISTLAVKKSVEPIKPNKIIDDNNNYLMYLDSLKKFEFEDELNIEMIDDFSKLNNEEKQLLNFIQKKLGDKKVLKGIMQVEVINRGNHKELNDIANGYKLFINIPKAYLNDFKKPYVARLLDLEEIKLEKEILANYTDEEKGLSLILNNIGTYLIYDDITIDYKYLDNTENQTYNIKDNGNLIIRIDAQYSKFIDVYMDDVLVDSKNYTSKEGSTIITFNQDYLQTLSVGTHNIKVNFTDGEANTTLNITNVNLTNTESIQTGDSIIFYIITAVIGFIGISGSILYLKKKRS